MLSTCSGVGLGVTPGVELEESLLIGVGTIVEVIEVSLFLDVGTSPGVPVSPADVGVDVSTCVVGGDPSTVKVYIQSVSISTSSTQHSEVLPQCSGLESTNL